MDEVKGFERFVQQLLSSYTTLSAGKDGSKAGEKDRTLAATITFVNGYDRDPWCFPYNGAGIEIRYTISPPTADTGCYYKTGVYSFKDGTTFNEVVPLDLLAVVTPPPLPPPPPPPPYDRVTVPSNAVTDRANCTTFVLVVTQKCGSAQERIVGTRIFKICDSCG